MAQRRSTNGPVAAARLLGKIMSPALRRRGFAQTEVVERWPAIVGSDLAEICVPEKLTFARSQTAGGTLHVRVAGAAALRVQHLLPQIIERVNGFYGYRAVGRIRLLQAPLPQSETHHRPAPRPLSPGERRQLRTMTSQIADERLQNALQRLGEAVASRTTGPGKST